MADKYSNVDFDFIKAEEGFEKKGYVPNLKFEHHSGVTIASGFDLGQRDEKDLKGLPESLIEKFKPYLGLKLDKASAKLKEMPLEVSLQEANIVNKFAKQKTFGNKLHQMIGMLLIKIYKTLVINIILVGKEKLII